MAEEIIVPVALFLCITAAILVPIYLRHRRTIAMIEHGVDPRAFGEVPRGKASLEGALITTGVGLALTIGLGFIGLGPWLLGGLIPLFIGLARLLAVLLRDEPETTADQEDRANG